MTLLRWSGLQAAGGRGAGGGRRGCDHRGVSALVALDEAEIVLAHDVAFLSILDRAPLIVIRELHTSRFHAAPGNDMVEDQAVDAGERTSWVAVIGLRRPHSNMADVTSCKFGLIR
jgi:hypothetical protein